MKKFIVSIMMAVLLATGQNGWSAGLRTLSYQGYLSTLNNVPVNDAIHMTFSLYDSMTGGSPVWTESQSAVTVENGVYTVLLGSSTALTITFDKIYYLGIAIGTDAEMSPRYELSSVPYAFRAVNADSADTLSLSCGDGQLLGYSAASKSWGCVTGAASGSGAGTWGSITGALANQGDLATVLAGKVGTATTVNGHALNGNISLAAGDLGLGNVNNTSDSTKPVSLATQTALNGKAASGVNNDITGTTALQSITGISSGSGNGGSITVTAGSSSGGSGNGGDIVLKAGSGNGSGTVGTVKILSGSSSVTFPTTVGTSGQTLATDGTGKLDWVTPSSSSDANGTTKGSVQLAGDLGGTASTPRVVSVGGATAASINSAVTLVNGATTSNSAGTLVKRDASGSIVAATQPIGDNSAKVATTAYAEAIAATRAASGANSDITSLSGLTRPLTVTQGGTGSNVRNFVDLTSSETIVGAKTFSQSIVGNLTGNVQGNISGSAASLSGSSVLPDGTTAVTQGAKDTSTKVATTAYVENAATTAVSNRAISGVNSDITSLTTVTTVKAPLGSTLTVSTPDATLSSGQSGADITIRAGKGDGSGSAGKVKIISNGATLTLPTTIGTTGQLLNTDANGNLGWADPTNLPDAASGIKGLLQLGGDLGGTSASPRVVSVGGSSAANLHGAEQAVSEATTATTANTLVKRDSSGNILALTQVLGDNSTKVATTAYTDSATISATSGKAAKGANSDITSLSGLSTALSVGQGGTGSAALTGYVKGLGSAPLTASATIPVGDVTGLGALATKTQASLTADVSGILPVANGGTGSNSRNYVDLTSSETIGGTKTFSSSIVGNVTGSATSLSAASTLPSGTGATTQLTGDNSTNIATTAYADSAASSAASGKAVSGANGDITSTSNLLSMTTPPASDFSLTTGAVTSGTASPGNITLKGGAGSSDSNSGGSVVLTGGSSSGSSKKAGAVILTGGGNTFDNGSANGGPVTLTGGVGMSGSGGEVTINGGTTLSTLPNVDGGAVILTGGTFAGVQNEPVRRAER